MTQKSEPLTPRNTGRNLGSAGERGVAITQSTYLNTNEIFVLSNSLGKKDRALNCLPQIIFPKNWENVKKITRISEFK